MSDLRVSDLSNSATETAGFIDEHLDIHKRIAGTRFLHASAGHGHLNLAYESPQGMRHIEIPNISVKISDTGYGAVVYT